MDDGGINVKANLSVCGDGRQGKERRLWRVTGVSLIEILKDLTLVPLRRARSYKSIEHLRLGGAGARKELLG